MTRFLVRCLFVLALAALFAPALAATHYVAPHGSDGAPGTKAKPWATIQHAADAIQPGDTIVVRAGDYAGAQFGDSASGSRGAATVLKAYPGETVQIVRDGGRGAGINLEGVSWMVVEGLTVDNRSKAGIRVVGGKQWGLSCAHVTIRNNHLEHNGHWGIFTAFCDDLRIEHNVAARSVKEHGIYVSNSGDRPLVVGNRVWGNHASGIQLNGDASQGGDGIISGAVIRGNRVHDNGVGGGSAINLDGVQDSVIRGNLLYDNHASGISLFRIDGGGPSSGNRVLNNTIVMPRGSRWALNIRNGARDTSVRNNILWHRGSLRGSLSVSRDSLAGLSSDYNVVMGRSTAEPGESVLDLAKWRARGQGSHSLTAGLAALFVDAAAHDYHLAKDSPAIAAGQALAEPGSDIDGTLRPRGKHCDIGAFAYPASTASR